MKRKSTLFRSIAAIAGLFLFVSLACGGSSTELFTAPADKTSTEINEVVTEAEYQVQATAQMPAQEAPLAAGGEAIPNDAAYDLMFFESEGVNPFIDAEDDRFSTFALDVDTGSYSIARRYVSDGYLPPKEAVRVEEFVNYFKQDYPSPPEGQAFSINLDGAPSPFTENERYEMIRVGLQGYSVAPEDRKDVSLTFVIDVSGSMNRENRLGLVKRSLALLVEQLRPSDSVAIVVYGSEARTVLEPTGGADTETILNAIYSLRSEGSTNAEAGLRLAYKQALSAFKPGGINRVILASDGVANVGNTSAESIWDTIKSYAGEGITLTAVGFGMGNYNDALMEQLADNGDGFYAYVDTEREAERLFVENLTSTLQVIALDAKVQVDFNPDVVSRYRLVGFENRAIADEDFRNDAVDAGEIGAGHNVTALYEVKLHPEAEGDIATVYLRWEDPDSREVVEINRSIASGDIAEAFSAASPYFQWDVIVAEYAEILRESYWAQNNSLAGVFEEAQRVSRLLNETPQVSEFVDLVGRATEISQEE